MKISAINFFNNIKFSGSQYNNEKQPKKIETVADFVDFAKRDAQNIEQIASKLKDNTLYLRIIAQDLKNDAQAYAMMAQGLYADRTLSRRCNPETFVSVAQGQNGSKVFLERDFEGNVKRSSTIFPDGSVGIKLARADSDELVNMFYITPDNSHVTVKLGVDLEAKDEENSEKVFIYKDGKLDEVHIGKSSNAKRTSIDRVYDFDGWRLTSVRNGFKFDGEKGEIKEIYELTPEQKLNKYSYKTEFTTNYKTTSAEFLFDNDSCIFENDDTSVLIESDGKACEYIKTFSVPLESGKDRIRSIKIDLKNI